MNALSTAVDRVLEAQLDSGKPLAIILAGHNGSGKSTMWKKHLSDRLQMPLVNADRMMLSILPDPNREGFLVDWAGKLRDRNESWMRVAQRGVQAFVAQAIGENLPFAMETVFSYWKEQPDGSFASKVDLINDLHEAGYFVLLCFVGLSNAQLSLARVQTRVARGGHDVEADKLLDRFPRTQKAIAAAVTVADAAILADNSLDEARAFTVCRIQLRDEEVYDVRDEGAEPAVLEWLDQVAPRV
jgi:predicted ABC-type ATPase